MHDSQDDRTAAAPSAVFRNPTSRANQARGFLCVSVFAALYGIQHHARAYRSFPETGESLTSPELWGFRFLLGLAGPSTAGWVTWAAGKGMDGIDENAAEHMGEAVSLGVLIPASVLLFMIISRVHNMQMTHYRRQRSAGTLSRTGSFSGRVPDQG